MKNIAKMALLAIGLASSATATQAALEIDFSGWGTIQFNGGITPSFQFNSVAPGVQFGVVNSTPVGDASGTGSFDTTPYFYGPITISGTTQSAPVTTLGANITITDATGVFTGKVDFTDVTTYTTGGGIGAVNSGLVFNVYGMAYTGTKLDTAALAAASMGKLNISFQNALGLTLTDLSAPGSVFRTSYSGSITAVPEPATFIAGLGALCLLGVTAMPRRKQ